MAGLHRKCLVLSVNLEQSDLAFRTAFPIMVTNSLGWFAGQSGELRQSLATGAVSNVALEMEAVGNSDDLVVRSPSESESKFHGVRPSSPTATTKTEPMSPTTGANSTLDGTAKPATIAVGSQNHPPEEQLTGKIGPLNEVGIWSVAAKAVDEKKKDSAPIDPLYEVAVNLANPRETDLQPSSDLLDSSKSRLNVAGWLSRPVWFYLIFAACALTTIEWFLYQRRLIT